MSVHELQNKIDIEVSNILQLSQQLQRAAISANLLPDKIQSPPEPSDATGTLEGSAAADGLESSPPHAQSQPSEKSISKKSENPPTQFPMDLMKLVRKSSIKALKLNITALNTHIKFLQKRLDKEGAKIVLKEEELRWFETHRIQNSLDELQTAVTKWKNELEQETSSRWTPHWEAQKFQDLSITMMKHLNDILKRISLNQGFAVKKRISFLDLEQLTLLVLKLLPPRSLELEEMNPTLKKVNDHIDFFIEEFQESLDFLRPEDTKQYLYFTIRFSDDGSRLLPTYSDYRENPPSISRTGIKYEG